MAGQRQYERTSFFSPVKLTVLPDGPTVEANSLDISIVGVGLNSHLFVEKGKNVIVQFDISNGARGITEETVFGRVTYSRADENANRLGIEFLQPIRNASQPMLSEMIDSL